MELTFVFYNANNRSKDTAVTKKLVCNDDAKVNTLIEKIREITINNFFPRDDEMFPEGIGSDWLWILEEQDNREILICYGNGIIKPVVNTDSSLSLWIFSITEPKLYFKFYSTKKSRAKYLYTHYKGDKYQMQIDGVLDEYNLYNVDRQTEQMWLLEKKKSIEIDNNNLIYMGKGKKKSKAKERSNGINFLFTVLKFFVLVWLGIEIILLPFENNNIINFLYDKFGAQIIEPASLVIGITFIILAILIVFFAIKDYEDENNL